MRKKMQERQFFVEKAYFEEAQIDYFGKIKGASPLRLKAEPDSLPDSWRPSAEKHHFPIKGFATEAGQVTHQPPHG